MAANPTTGVGLAHPTVVPEDAADSETNGYPVRCPACGRPLAGHATTER